MKRNHFLSVSILLPASMVSFLVSCAQSPEARKPDDIFYANTAKHVKYVGSEACADCHSSIYQSYLQSEMGRSMARLEASPIIEQFPQNDEVFDPSRNYYYQMAKRDGRFFQREYRRDNKGRLVHERWMEAEYVIGSGNNLRMYFHDENGMLYQLPLTWYVHKKKWDLSPGFREFENLRFSRYATPRCIACHNSFLQPKPTANDRYAAPFDLGIGCERCHGPGDLHVRQQNGEKLLELPPNAKTIVNPAKLAPERQLDVCRQCHLQGKAVVLHGDSEWFDYRPGLPLQTHRAVYYPTTDSKSVFEVADSPHRLALSRCYRESSGRMTCLTCHNPHYSIKTFTRAHYNAKCASCHTSPGKTARHSHAATDDCVSCHMNRTGTDNTLHGVSNTDHWIRVDADKAKIDWTSLLQPQALVSLSADIDAMDESAPIRKGIAYWDYYWHHDRRPAYLDSALSYLLPGLRRVPNFAPGYFYLGEVQTRLERYDEAIAAFSRAAALRPNDAEAYYKLGSVYAALQKFAPAIRCYQQALQYKPDDPGYLEGLGMAYADSGMYAEAVPVLERALQGDRLNPYTYFTLGNFYVQQLRQPEKGISYFETLVTLDPDFPNGYLNLGVIQGMMKNYGAAIKTFERELYFRPQSAPALLNLGRVHALAGNKEAARQAFQNALAIDPSLDLAKQYLDNL
jgi:tetratricopeptide (TPR) repeat protein